VIQQTGRRILNVWGGGYCRILEGSGLGGTTEGVAEMASWVTKSVFSLSNGIVVGHIFVQLDTTVSHPPLHLAAAMWLSDQWPNMYKVICTISGPQHNTLCTYFSVSFSPFRTEHRGAFVPVLTMQMSKTRSWEQKSNKTEETWVLSELAERRIVPFPTSLHRSILYNNMKENSISSKWLRLVLLSLLLGIATTLSCCSNCCNQDME
jgi:hypothetical protein